MYEVDFWAVHWQPWSDSMERFVTHVVVRPRPSSGDLNLRGAFVTLSLERLRAIVGAKNARSASGILTEVALYISEALNLDGEVTEDAFPFHGFGLGNSRTARGFSAGQILDTCIRSVSILSQHDGALLSDYEPDRRSSIPTSRFLSKLRKSFSGDDQEKRARFGRKITARDAALEISVDYSFKRWMVQVSTLPSSMHQIALLQKEAQSKLLELEALRKIMDGNQITPVLLVNEPSSHLSEEQADLCSSMKSRLQVLTKTFSSELLSAQSNQQAVAILEKLE